MSDLTDALPVPEALNKKMGKEKKTFRLIPCQKIGASLTTDEVVENLLGHGGLSVLYGPSNSGKSFIALDLAACIADNRKYHGGLAVEGGGVVYITLEGQKSFRNRIAALKMNGLLSESAELHILLCPMNLLDGDDCEALLQETDTLTLWTKPRLVIVDTLARAIAGADENSGVDMTALINAVDNIRTKSGAHVMLVHHTGKDAEKGARGHSSLRAAVDTEIEVSQQDGQIIVQVKKQRDLPFLAPMAYRLKQVNLGLNDREQPVTSCIVEYQPDVSFTDVGGKKRARAAHSHEDVIALVPETGSIHKNLLKETIRRQFSVTHRAADHIIAEMCQKSLLHEISVKPPNGVKKIHIERCPQQ